MNAIFGRDTAFGFIADFVAKILVDVVNSFKILLTGVKQRRRVWPPIHRGVVWVDGVRSVDRDVNKASPVP